MNRKSILLGFLILIGILDADAQVKLGDNPNTINSNSLFEMETTNKGMLPPRVALTSATSVSPLSGTVPSGMTVYSSGGTLADGYYYWNGTKWLQLLTSANDRNNFVRVKSASDFPAPVGGVITLSGTTMYEINGTILLTSKIDLNSAWICGGDAVNDRLVYTPTSGELFTGTNGGNIRTLSLVASGVGAKVFNLDAANASKNLVIQNCYIVSSDNIGLIKGFGGTIYMNTIAFQNNNNGITFQNNYNLIELNLLWDITNKNTYEKFVGTFNVIQKVAGDMLTSSANSAIGMDVSGITSLVAGELKVTLFTGSGTPVNGTFSNQWEVEAAGLNTVKDGVAAGNVYMTTAAATNFSAINTPTKVLGTTAATGLFRVTSPASNQLKYTGSKTRSFQVICSMTATQTSSNKYFSFYIAKNGVILPESRQEVKIINSTDQGAITLSCTTNMAPNDYIEVWVENETATNSLTVQTLNLAIQ